MYAIIRTGGKQYQVEAGDRLRVEKLEGEVGATIELDEVLLLVDGESIQIGRPVLEGAKVLATIVEQGRQKKIIVFKKKRRKGYQVKKGPRQFYTALNIDTISA